MDKQRRKELQAQAAEIKTRIGVLRVTNTASGKVFLQGFNNIKNKAVTQADALRRGQHMNAALQADWKAFGEEAFRFEVLEEADAKDDRDETALAVRAMERKWHAILAPYGDKGYNKPL